MSRLRDLLPSRSTDLERNLVEVVDSRSRMAGLVARIVGARYGETVDPALLPWLLRDWGLEDAAAFLDDWQLLYREGKAWTRERGTDAAQLRALRWLGWEGGTVEPILPGGNRWALYQLGLPAAPETLTAIPGLVGLSRLSKPARSVLDRIHGGFDVRAIRLDETTADGGLLDADSGVVLDPAWPILSFGRRVLDELDTTDSRGGLDDLATQVLLGNAMYIDDVMLDWSVPDDQLRSLIRDFDMSIVDTTWTNDPLLGDAPIETWRLIKAAIGFDYQWDTADLNQVFVGCRFEPRGVPWVADGFRPEADTDWREPFVVEEIKKSVVEGTHEVYAGGSSEVATRTRDSSLVVAVDIQAEAASDATISTSSAGSAAVYGAQSWFDLRWPEGVAWKDLGPMVGNP